MGAQFAEPQSIDETSVDDNLVVEMKNIWERLLKITPISADDDFFENGGDSLLAMEMLAELEELVGRPLSITILLDAPTISQPAKKLSEKDYLPQKSLFQLHSNGSQTPLFYFHANSTRADIRHWGWQQPWAPINRFLSSNHMGWVTNKFHIRLKLWQLTVCH